MTKALVVMVAALSFGFAGTALAASSASKGSSSNASSSKASSQGSPSASKQGSPAASKAAASGALNANGPSLNGFDGELVIFSKSDRIILPGEPNSTAR